MMWRYGCILFFTVASLFAQYRSGQIDSVRQAIDAVYADDFFNNIGTGFFAKSLLTGQTIHQKNPDSLRSTASCMKLVTTAAALDRWGTNKNFRTEFRYNGAFKNGIVDGDLYIKGLGDPYFLPEILLRAVYHLKALGLTEIRGDIVGDDTYLIDSENAETNDRAYSAVGGALGFNFNIINICVRPGEKAGDSAIVFIEPISSLVKVINGVKTTDSSEGIGVNHNNTFIRYNGNQMTVALYGTIAKNEGEFVIYKRVPNPTWWTIANIKETLGIMGIKVTGGLRIGKTPKASKLLIDPPSYDLSYIVAGINKWSNNYVVGQLLMIMGAEMFGEPGTDEKGIRAIQPFLRNVGISEKEIQMADGSGLDERNKMTTRAQVRLLEYMYRDFRYASDYIASLSIGGVDGTEKKRFIKRKDEASLISTTRLKVGFLYGVSGLSGYIETQSKDIIAFSILTNGYPKEYYETMRQFEDRIVKALGSL